MAVDSGSADESAVQLGTILFNAEAESSAGSYTLVQLAKMKGLNGDPEAGAQFARSALKRYEGKLEETEILAQLLPSTMNSITADKAIYERGFWQNRDSSVQFFATISDALTYCFGSDRDPDLEADSEAVTRKALEVQNPQTQLLALKAAQFNAFANSLVAMEAGSFQDKEFETIVNAIEAHRDAGGTVPAWNFMSPLVASLSRAGLFEFALSASELQSRWTPDTSYRDLAKKSVSIQSSNREWVIRTASRMRALLDGIKSGMVRSVDVIDELQISMKVLPAGADLEDFRPSSIGLAIATMRVEAAEVYGIGSTQKEFVSLGRSSMENRPTHPLYAPLSVQYFTPR